MLAGIAEFERDLLRERVRSGLAAARARGKMLGRQLGQRLKSDRLAPKVLADACRGQHEFRVGLSVKYLKYRDRHHHKSALCYGIQSRLVTPGFLGRREP
jgi:Resolvase, N terminal domain